MRKMHPLEMSPEARRQQFEDWRYFDERNADTNRRSLEYRDRVQSRRAAIQAQRAQPGADLNARAAAWSEQAKQRRYQLEDERGARFLRERDALTQRQDQQAERNRLQRAQATEYRQRAESDAADRMSAEVDDARTKYAQAPLTPEGKRVWGDLASKLRAIQSQPLRPGQRSAALSQWLNELENAGLDNMIVKEPTAMEEWQKNLVVDPQSGKRYLRTTRNGAPVFNPLDESAGEAPTQGPGVRDYFAKNYDKEYDAAMERLVNRSPESDTPPSPEAVRNEMVDHARQKQEFLDSLGGQGGEEIRQARLALRGGLIAKMKGEEPRQDLGYAYQALHRAGLDPDRVLAEEKQNLQETLSKIHEQVPRAVSGPALPEPVAQPEDIAPPQAPVSPVGTLWDSLSPSERGELVNHASERGPFSESEFRKHVPWATAENYDAYLSLVEGLRGQQKPATAPADIWKGLSPTDRAMFANHVREGTPYSPSEYLRHVPWSPKADYPSYKALFDKVKGDITASHPHPSDPKQALKLVMEALKVTDVPKEQLSQMRPPPPLGQEMDLKNGDIVGPIFDAGGRAKVGMWNEKLGSYVLFMDYEDLDQLLRELGPPHQPPSRPLPSLENETPFYP